MALTPRSIAYGAGLLLVYNLLPAALAPPKRGAERGVRQALMRLNDLLARRDMAILREFAADRQLVGSETGENARGRAELETFFAKLYGLPQTLAFSWREVQVQVRGSVAWLFAEGQLVMRGGEAGEARVAYRVSGVLELEHGLWRWRLFHGSQPKTQG